LRTSQKALNSSWICNPGDEMRIMIRGRAFATHEIEFLQTGTLNDLAGRLILRVVCQGTVD
jgi:hypothetical protein